MAIEPYQRRIGVEIPQGTNVQLRQVADVGPAIGDLGKSLLTLAEPYLKERATNAAIEAVGVASIAKDEKGNFIRPPVPPGGGLVYNQVYNQAMDDRYSEQVIKGFQRRADAMASLYPHNPAAYTAAMEADWRGTMEAVDPRTASQIDIGINREMSERARGAYSRFAAEEHNSTVLGIKQAIGYRVDEIQQINSVGYGTPEEIEQQDQRKAILLKDIETFHAQLVVLGEESELGAASEMGDLGLKVQSSNEDMLAISAIAQTDKLFAQMGDEDLEALARAMERGGSELEKIGPLSTDQWLTTIKPPEYRGRMASIARREVADRQQKAAAAGQVQADAIELAYDQQVLGFATEFGGRGGMPPDYEKSLERSLLRNGPIGVQMADKTTRAALADWINTYGYISKDVVDYINTSATNPNQSEQILGWVNDLRTSRHRKNGVVMGEQLFNKLSAGTRALVQLHLSAMHGQISEEDRRKMVERYNAHEIPTMEQVLKLYDRGLASGVSYQDHKTALLTQALGGQYSQVVSHALPMQSDFDNLYRVNLQLHGGNQEQAMQATAAHVAQGWMVSNMFIGNYGPREVLQSGLEVQDLSAVFQHDDVHNKLHATFNGINGYFLRLEPLDDMATDGQGDYEVTIWKGNPTQATSRQAAPPWRVVMSGVNARAWNERRKRLSPQQEQNLADERAKNVMRRGADMTPMGIGAN